MEEKNDKQTHYNTYEHAGYYQASHLPVLGLTSLNCSLVNTSNGMGVSRLPKLTCILLDSIFPKTSKSNYNSGNTNSNMYKKYNDVTLDSARDINEVRKKLSSAARAIKPKVKREGRERRHDSPNVQTNSSEATDIKRILDIINQMGKN